MVDFKWVIIGLLLLFGGLFLYEKMSKVELEEYEAYGFPILLQGVAQQLENGDVVDAKVRNAKHYLIYVASSTNSDCKDSIAKFFIAYQDRVEGGQELEVIMYCLDSKPSEVFTWVKQEGLTWPLLLDSDEAVKAAHLPFRAHLGTEVPAYVLLDKDGELVAKSSSYEQLLEQLEL